MTKELFDGVFSLLQHLDADIKQVTITSHGTFASVKTKFGYYEVHDFNGDIRFTKVDEAGNLVEMMF